MNKRSFIPPLDLGKAKAEIALLKPFDAGDKAGDVVPAWLLKKTFRVEYSPNCPSPWLVRLVRGNRARIYGDKGDACGYGKTIGQAADNALLEVSKPYVEPPKPKPKPEPKPELKKAEPKPKGGGYILNAQVNDGNEIKHRTTVVEYGEDWLELKFLGIKELETLAVSIPKEGVKTDVFFGWAIELQANYYHGEPRVLMVTVRRVDPDEPAFIIDDGIPF